MRTLNCSQGFFTDDIFQNDPNLCTERLDMLIGAACFLIFTQIVESFFIITHWILLYCNRASKILSKRKSHCCGRRLPLLPMLSSLQTSCFVILQVFILLDLANFENGLSITILSLANLFRACQHILRLRGFRKVGFKSIPLARNLLHYEKQSNEMTASSSAPNTNFKSELRHYKILITILEWAMGFFSISAAVFGVVCSLLFPNTELIVTLYFIFVTCWIFAGFAFSVQIQLNIQALEEISIQVGYDRIKFEETKKRQREMQILSIIHVILSLSFYLTVAIGVRSWWFVLLTFFVESISYVILAVQPFLGDKNIKITTPFANKKKKPIDDAALVQSENYHAIKSDDNASYFGKLKTLETNPAGTWVTEIEDNTVDDTPTYEEAYNLGFQWIRWTQNLEEERKVFNRCFAEWKTLKNLNVQ